MIRDALPFVDSNRMVLARGLRWFGYGAVSMTITTWVMGEQAVVLFPVAMLIILTGLLIESITNRQGNTAGAAMDANKYDTTADANRLPRSAVGAEISADTIEKQYSNDWYAEHPGWHEDMNTDTSGCDGE